MSRENHVRWKMLVLTIASLVLMPSAAACGGSGSTTSGSSSGTTVQVSEKEWSITVSGTVMTNGNGNANLPAGTVTFSIKNDGSVTHQFEIQGNGISKKTGNIDVGTTVTLTIDLKPGSYEVFCPIPGHKQAGMDGHVTAS